jgi:D-alanyl-lipoteichoic acid acyltransferase DltB (MBOAT superfamily)
MKIVIADQCAVHANILLTNSSTIIGSNLILGIFLFTIQIYADFAGYSNIAIGIGKLLGFNIMQNFAYPYFARDIREFWKRWNISLTTWFRDYVFLPIAYSVSRNIKSDRFYLMKTEFLIYTLGIGVTWILTGLWHGANYTFIIWGLLQGFFLLINHVTSKIKRKALKRLNIKHNNTFLTISDTLATFIIIMFSWLFFRADTIEHAFRWLSVIFSSSSFMTPHFDGKRDTLVTLFIICIFFIVEWHSREKEYGVASLGKKWSKPLRWVLYYSIIATIFWYSGKEQQFIYFRF